MQYEGKKTDIIWQSVVSEQSLGNGIEARTKTLADAYAYAFDGRGEKREAQPSDITESFGFRYNMLSSLKGLRYRRMNKTHHFGAS
jgi:IS5 family transposase